MNRTAKFPNGLLESDYHSLTQTVEKKKTYKLADVKDKIEKVAFDVVRFIDAENLDKLWIVKDENGDKVLVAMYDEESPEINKAASPKWSAVPDSFGNVNVFYKGETITKLAMNSFGLETTDARAVCRFLPEKLASDKVFVNGLLNQLSDSDRKAVYSKYPELKG